MKLKEVNKKVLRFLGNHFLHTAISALCNSLKINQINFETVKKLQENKQNFVLAFWHGTMLVPWYLQRNNNFAALVSPSKDGELLFRLLKKWNYNVVRGSSNESGSEALDKLINFANENFSVSITPDGPKGPQFKMKAGAVVTAKKSGIPIILLGIHYEKKRKLKSWDKFEIPEFFSKVNVIYSDPVYIDKDLNFEMTSEKILQCESLLNEIQKKAEQL